MIFDFDLLAEMIRGGFVREQRHPTLPLRILNYSEKTAYDGVWNDVTRQCRGLILDGEDNVVARPFPKFFNYGEPQAPELDLDAPVVVTDKLDGSLGILYPTETGHAIATRGSFISDQAVHATAVYQARYGNQFVLIPEATYLFEIIYPGNRIVVDYRDTDDLFLLASLDTATGKPFDFHVWPGPACEMLAYPTLTDALAAEPRPNCEGFVVYFPDTDVRVKLKQDDYVSLHRILTGTNARHVWEVAAVQSCALLIQDPKHWGSYLGIDPARAEQVLALGDDWLADVPDEFFDWVRSVIEEAQDQVDEIRKRAERLADQAALIEDRKQRYEFVSGDPLVKEIMRLASASTAIQRADARFQIKLRAWREATPEPTAPFARSEAIA